MPRRAVPLTAVQPREAEWLWAGRIPFGAITVVEGDPGSNKSTLLYDLAARVSAARPPPVEGRPPPHPAAVLLFQGEDPPARVRRSVEAAGGDAGRVHVFVDADDGGDGGGAAGPVKLPDDVGFVRDEVRRLNARLVVFDPLSTFLRGSVNSDRAVRAALTPLAAVAEETGAAVVLVRHLRKGGARDPLHAGAGSIALIAASRSGLRVAAHPADPELRVVAQFRSSFGPLSPTLMFMPVNEDNRLRLVWRGRSPLSARELASAAAAPAGDSALREAMEFLVDTLTLGGGGPVPVGEVKRQARGAGIADRTLRRAKEFLDVRSDRHGYGPGGTFTWQLPADSEVVALLQEQRRRPGLQAITDANRRRRRKITPIDWPID